MSGSGLMTFLGTVDMEKASVFDSVLSTNLKKTRWYKCRICGDQFAYRRLLEAHKKLVSCSVESSK